MLLARLYQAFLDSDLRRALERGDIVIMDYLGSHKSRHVCDAIEIYYERLAPSPGHAPEMAPAALAA